MDNSTIETLAVTTIQNAVVLSNHLKQYIKIDDKEPSVDGFVNLYNKGGKTKENYYGRVAVQVKGKQKVISSNKKEMSYSVSIADLKFYIREGGVIYFVVLISPDGKQQRIFYNDLLPIKVYKILESSKAQTTKSLKFRELTDIKNIDRLFFSFYDQKKKQSTNLIDLSQLPSIDKLQKESVLEKLTLSIPNVEGYRDPTQAILNNDIYVYAHVKGLSYSIPVDVMSDDSYMAVAHEVHNKISAGNITYDKGKIIETLDDTTLNIDNWLIAKFSKNTSKKGRKVEFKFTPRSTLRERAKDMEFLLAFIDEGGFYLGENFCEFRAELNEDNFDIDDKREQLVFMKKVLRLFEILHISENLDMSILTQSELQELNILITAFVDEKPTNYLRNDLPCNYSVKIGNIIIALCHYEKDRNRYIDDMFNGKFAVGFDVDDLKHFVPAFAILNKGDWAKISNINFESVQSAFAKFYEQYQDLTIFEVANNTMLSMFLAYDQTHNPKLLEAIIKLSMWLCENDSPENFGKEYSLVNYLQAIKRKRKYEKSESHDLIKIAENSKIDVALRVAAYLLLDNYDAAEMHFEKLDENVQNAFREWPIYLFWRNNKCELMLAGE